MPRAGKKPKGPMRRVFVSVDQALELRKEGSAVTLTIRTASAKLGTLSVGRGSLVWWGRKDHNGVKLSWRYFARLMEKVKDGSV